MGATATFSYSAWISRYPEFATTVADPVVAAQLFAEAALYLANDGTSPVCDPNIQLMLLNMLTAHIAQLNFGSSVQAVNGVVGRLSDASEGSVSVSTDNEYEPGTPQWYQQTKYGSAFWAATVRFRSLPLYRSGPVRNFAPGGFYGRRLF